MRYSKSLIHGEANAVQLDDGSWAAVGWKSHYAPHDRVLYGRRGGVALYERLWPNGSVGRTTGGVS
jgi:hypothetical protein